MTTDLPPIPPNPASALVVSKRVALHVYHYENVLGTSLELKIDAPSDALAKRAESAAFAEIDRIAKVISTYNINSEFSRWAATEGQPVKLAPEIIDVLSLYDRWQQIGQGTLNAGAESVYRLWESAAREQRLPDAAEMEAAIAAAPAAHWQIDAVDGTVTRLGSAPLTLNAAGKGYIVGRACDAAMSARGVRGAVVNIGGDICVRGELSENVDITNPRDPAENAAPIARVALRNAAVATSGNYRRGFEIAGTVYSHVIDPRTGKPVEDVISATAIAPDAGDADALATIFSVMTPAESLRLADALPGVKCLLVTKDGERIASRDWAASESPIQLGAPGDISWARVASGGWKPSQAPMQLADLGDFQVAANDTAPVPAATPAAAFTTPAGADWDASRELVVNLQLAQIMDQRARRPYVAVWVEDADKFPIRTLGLWYNARQAKYLRELRSWNQADQLRSVAEGTDIKSSVSSATRGPGKYILKWDGKDNTGKPVKAGKYTVLIEVSREHGTHQLIEKEMDFSGAPQQIDIPANPELAGASFDYRAKTN